MCWADEWLHPSYIMGPFSSINSAVKGIGGTGLGVDSRAHVTSLCPPPFFFKAKEKKGEGRCLWFSLFPCIYTHATGQTPAPLHNTGCWGLRLEEGAESRKTRNCCMLNWEASLLELKAMLNAKQFDNIIPPNIKSFKLLSNAWKADLCNMQIQYK